MVVFRGKHHCVIAAGSGKAWDVRAYATLHRASDSYVPFADREGGQMG
jgi:hypothetical protein